MNVKAVKLALLAATSTAAVALAPTAYAGVAPSFQTPSGNIYCWLADNAATCHIVEYTYTSSSDCPAGEWPSSLWLSAGKPAEVRCSEQPPGTYNGMRTDVTLDYGQSSSAGVMTCVSEQAGVVCTDTSSGHYFRMSRDTYQLG